MYICGICHFLISFLLIMNLWPIPHNYVGIRLCKIKGIGHFKIRTFVEHFITSINAIFPHGHVFEQMYVIELRSYYAQKSIYYYVDPRSNIVIACLVTLFICQLIVHRIIFSSEQILQYISNSLYQSPCKIRVSSWAFQVKYFSTYFTQKYV